MTKFRDLALGQRFDWVDDEHRWFNSFFNPCQKTGERKYDAFAESGTIVHCRVGTINAEVFHVQQIEEPQN